MATGIISTGTFLLGPAWLSQALLAAASAGLVVLSVALAARLDRGQAYEPPPPCSTLIESEFGMREYVRF